MRRVSGLLVVAVLLAGCDHPASAQGCAAQEQAAEPTGDPLAPQALMSWVEQVVELPNGSLRPRVPSQAGHACTADWLEAALAVDGWRVVRSDFTGADYQALPAGGVARYTTACDDTDAAEVAGMEMTNLAAVWDGAGDRSLLIAAHWDAKEDADGGGVVPAANDGASGMAVILALQRHIAAQGIALPFDLAVAFFDAEDGFADCHPLAGSIHFAHTMPVAVDRLLLLDMVGDEDARFPREGRSVQSDPALVDLVWGKAPAHGLEENFVDVQRDVLDDHVPFIEVGVPSVDIIDLARPAGQGRFGFPPYWHTVEDTPDKLSGDMMARVAQLVLDVIQDPAFVEQWPGHSG